MRRTREEIAKMRRAGRVVAEMHARTREAIRPGRAGAGGAGFSVGREYVGPAIGTAMHEDPQVPNYGPPGRGPRLRPGLVLAVEPMVNAGGPGTRLLADGWSVVTADGSLSAHFEHTIAVGQDG